MRQYILIRSSCGVKLVQKDVAWQGYVVHSAIVQGDFIMKWFVASDIHGSEKYCRQMLSAFEREGADRLLLLGDLLYHGPRNDLPEGYAPKAVIELLNGQKGKVISIRGNCDAQVDQMVLDFPILADYCMIETAGRLIFVTHGHEYGSRQSLPLAPGDILLCGHTHVPSLQVKDEGIYMNPGSVSLPKEASWHGYMVIENGVFLWKDLEGKEFMRHVLK